MGWGRVAQRRAGQGWAGYGRVEGNNSLAFMSITHLVL